MTITGINYRFTIFSLMMDHTSEAEIPLAGDDLVMTETIRETYQTLIKKFPLSEDTVARYLGLIDKYGITGWVGKTPAAPVVYDDTNTHTISFLTLKFDDGSSADITFREADAETGKEAAEEFRKLFFDAARDDKKISEETIYPDLKACRNIKEEHGPVVAVETGSSSSGMMMGSNESYYQTVEKIKDKEGYVLVTVKRKRGNGPEVISTEETASDILARVNEISVKENLPGWNYACADPKIPVDTSMIPTDYSSSGWLNIYYDDSLITGCPRAKRTIGEKACKMGGKDVDKTITGMINECVAKSGAKTELPEINPFMDPNMPPFSTAPNPMMGYIGMGMAMGAGAGMDTSNTAATLSESVSNPDGSWDCSCGNKGITGKFCPECGQRRP